MVTLVNGNVGAALWHPRQAALWHPPQDEGWNRFGLLGGQVAGVDEHEFAAVKADRPPPGGAHKLVLPDPNRMTADFTEIVDHDSAPFSVRSWVHPHTRINPNAVCGTVVVAWSLGHTWRLEVDHPDNGHLSPTSWICVVAMRFSPVGLFPGMRSGTGGCRLQAAARALIFLRLSLWRSGPRQCESL
jgi:hypothetical protein